LRIAIIAILLLVIIFALPAIFIPALLLIIIAFALPLAIIDLLFAKLFITPFFLPFFFKLCASYSRAGFKCGFAV